MPPSINIAAEGSVYVATDYTGHSAQRKARCMSQQTIQDTAHSAQRKARCMSQQTIQDTAHKHKLRAYAKIYK